MNLFLKYLKAKKVTIVFIILFIFIFLLSFELYHLPIMAVIYPFIISSVIGFILLIVTFLGEKKKHDALIYTAKLSSAMIEMLPESSEFLDDDYKLIISQIRQNALTEQQIEEAKYRDLVEYYTVWAHQIKTPISSMKLTLGNMDSLEARRMSADLFRIEQYVEMVLTYLRLDAESTDYVFRKHFLDDIIKSSVKKFMSEFIGRKISLKYEPISYSFITDEKWFAFVFEQLLSNALKYTNEGSISIYMSDENVLCIEDTGIGIEKEDLPRIFEKGYTGKIGRLDHTATGLGLYLCKRTCDNLGIGILASSTPSVGTKIYLDLSQYDKRKE